MSEIDSKLSPLEGMALESAEEQFPKVSREVCSNREGGLCKITGEACELYSCPKLMGDAWGEKERSGR